MASVATVTPVAVINCVDGFVQDTVLNWVQERFGVPAGNVMTVWAPDKMLSDTTSQHSTETKNYVLSSLASHPAQCIIVVGHEGCTHNQVSREDHLQQIQQSVETLTSWDLHAQGSRVNIIGLWMSAEGSAEIVSEN